MSSYYVYKISQTAGQIVKQLKKIELFDNYKEAKSLVRTLRNELASGDSTQYKIIFAESELDAEDKLQEKRDAPIIMEWEK